MSSTLRLTPSRERVRMLIALRPEFVRPVGEAIERALQAESGVGTGD